MHYGAELAELFCDLALCSAVLTRESMYQMIYVSRLEGQKLSEEFQP